MQTCCRHCNSIIERFAVNIRKTEWCWLGEERRERGVRRPAWGVTTLTQTSCSAPPVSAPRRGEMPGSTFPSASPPLLLRGRPVWRDVVAVIMDFSRPLVAHTLAILLRRCPSAPAPPLSRSGPPETRCADLDSKEPLDGNSFKRGAPDNQVRAHQSTIFIGQVEVQFRILLRHFSQFISY